MYFLKSKSDTVAATQNFGRHSFIRYRSNVLDQTMVVNLFLRSLSLCWRKIRLSMKSPHPILSTKMGQQSDIGEPYLKWKGVYFCILI